jgi:hypothetical protein
MIRLAPALLLLVACKESDSMLPVNPGGGGGGVGTSSEPDAATTNGDAGLVITGRVCKLSDPRTLTSCAATGAAGLTVALGSSSAVTADDGAFMLMRPASTTGLYYTVTGPGVVPSAIKYGTTTTLPALATLIYEDMLVSTQAVVVTGQGAIIGRFTRAGAAVTNAIVIAQPQSDSDVYYDGASHTEWQTAGTGSFGVAWIPSEQVGTASLTVKTGAVQNTVAGVAVFGDTITYVLAEIP